MLEPLGRRHPTLRRLRALRRDGALRRAEGVLLAEGVKLAREALKAPQRIELIVASPRLHKMPEGEELLRAIEIHGVNCQWTTDEWLEGVQDARAPQPILTLVRAPLPAKPASLLDRAQEPALLLASCDLQDPGNLGTLLRTAEAAGASGCFVCGRSADPWHPRTVRASAGAILRLPWAEVTPAELIGLARERHLAVLGADAAASTSHDACDLTRSLILFVGSESAGLPEVLLRELDERIRIPMNASVESLSVAAAAAVILFEAARQRRVGLTATRLPDIDG